MKMKGFLIFMPAIVTLFLLLGCCIQLRSDDFYFIVFSFSFPFYFTKITLSRILLSRSSYCLS